MDSHDSANWQMANWSNGNPFNNTWQPNNISFNDGIMTLILDNVGCPQSCDGRPYASGEYRTGKEIYGYGYYEARMRPAAGGGLMSGSLFIYRGTYGQSSHDEIDFEFLGKDCNIVQTNYYVEGRGNHESIINLGFNACEEFHNYGFRWSADSIIWYVDGGEVHRAEEDPSTPEHDIPYRPSKIMVNFWTGTSDLIGWLGDFSYPGHSLQAQYDWIRYSPLSAGQQPASTQSPAPTTTVPATTSAAAPAVPANPLQISTIQQGSSAWNGGELVLSSSGTYQFSASEARDPGFTIQTGNQDLSGRNKLVFEIRGSFQRHGGYARFIAQAYDDGDNDYTPSISLDPVELTNGFQTVTFNLENMVNKIKKVQFLLVTDSGSCQVEIRNIRFE
jgi:beta-glucanase (GH16 family)